MLTVERQEGADSNMITVTKHWDPPVDLSHFTEEQQRIIKRMLYEESRAFAHNDDDAGCVPSLQMSINLMTTFLFREHIPQFPSHCIKKFIQYLLVRGWSLKSKSSYSAPVVCVRKKDGTLGLCVDYRLLNEKTISDRHPLPRIQDLTDTLGGYSCFSILDQGKAYH